MKLKCLLFASIPNNGYKCDKFQIFLITKINKSININNLLRITIVSAKNHKRLQGNFYRKREKTTRDIEMLPNLKITT